MIDSFPVLFAGYLGAIFAGLLLCAFVVAILRQAAFNQARRRWVKDIGGKP